jgi:citrate lyase subunit beta-like protein
MLWPCSSQVTVPATSDRMLQSSLRSASDVIIYDLEDSVPPSVSDKKNARQRLCNFLGVYPLTQLSQGHSWLYFRSIPLMMTELLFVSTMSPPHSFTMILPKQCVYWYFETRTLGTHSSIGEQLQHTSVTTLVLPKIHSAQDLHYVSREIRNIHVASPRDPKKSPLRIVASIESAKGLWNLGDIAAWKSEYGSHLGGSLSALLVRAIIHLECRLWADVHEVRMWGLWVQLASISYICDKNR